MTSVPGQNSTSATGAKLQPTFTPTRSALVESGLLSATVPAPSALTAPGTLLPTPLPTPTPPADPADLLALGRYRERIGDYAAARASLLQLLALPQLDQPLQFEAQSTLAQIYLAEHAYTEAIALLESLRSVKPGPGVGVGAVVASSAPTISTLSVTLTSSLTSTLTATLASTLPLTLFVTDAPAAKADYLLGEALMAQGAYAQAIAAYWRFLDSYPWMAEFVQSRIAAAYLATGDNAGASAAYRRAADATTDSVARARLLEALATTYVGAARYQDAVAVYDEILALAKNPNYRAQIQYLAGKTLVSAGDTPGAVVRWRAATAEAPESGSAYGALIELVNRDVDFDLYLRGYIDLQADAFEPAIKAFQAYLASVDATDNRVGQALHGIGQAYLRAENYSAAIKTLDQVIAQYSTCPCYGQAWLDKAAALAASGDPIGARRSLRTFARDHAADPLAPEALWRSGQQALWGDNRAESSADFLHLADAFPDSTQAPTALYWVGLGAYLTGDFGQAATAFDRLQRNYPGNRTPAALYWLGRAYAAGGQASQAHTAWQSLLDQTPDDYYGILAAQALRQIPTVAGNFLNAMPTISKQTDPLAGDDGSQSYAEKWLRAWLKTPNAALTSLSASVAEDQDLRIGQLLLELDQRGPALVVLERVYQRYRDEPQPLYALSLAFEEMGAYRLSLLCMARLLELSPAHVVEEAPLFLQKHVYPQPFAELITQEALANNLNPLLYFSLIRQESLFEEGARSTAAAQGLAQIVPATGLEIAQQLGHADYTNEIIYRPHINLRFGAYYLARARNYLDGNIVSALVGYNAGPGYSQSQRAYSGADDTLFVEQLSLLEPRTYVQAITINLYYYTRLYGN
ncbi:MAG: transglycosylase SLT domain-containing protein [Caldilineaceae bacterium]